MNMETITGYQVDVFELSATQPMVLRSSKNMTHEEATAKYEAEKKRLASVPLQAWAVELYEIIGVHASGDPILKLHRLAGENDDWIDAALDDCCEEGECVGSLGMEGIAC
jgi:hypothetical protein